MAPPAGFSSLKGGMTVDILIEAVRRLEKAVQGSGAEDAVVAIAPDPDAVYCRYEKGACLKARSGGRSAEFITFHPVDARTKIGFVFGAELRKMPQRAAAAAILNVTSGFFCLSRILKSCDPMHHRDCLAALEREIGDKQIFPLGLHENVLAGFHSIVRDIDRAEVVLVNGDGGIEPGTGDLIARARGSKRIIFVGPSTAGMSAVLGCEHWCPFGKG